MSHKSDLDRVLEEIDRKQKATTLPDTLNAGHSVDEFLWKGDPNATPIQRAGLVIFTIMALMCFVASIVLIVRNHDVFSRAFGLVAGTIAGIAGFRFLKNAFRRKPLTSRYR